MNDLIPPELIETKIYFIRGLKVMLDRDLASLYGVETRALKQAIRRNIDRFPEDFMFELSKEEDRSLRSQNVILKRGRHSKYSDKLQNSSPQASAPAGDNDGHRRYLLQTQLCDLCGLCERHE